MACFRILHFSDPHFSNLIDVKNFFGFNILDRVKYAQLRLRHGKNDSRVQLIKERIDHIKKGDRRLSYGKLSSHNRNTTESLIRWLDRFVMNAEQDQAIHGILVSGDLACVGRNCELTAARDFFAGQLPGVPAPRRLPSEDSPIRAPNLLGHHIPILFLPGNHDRYQNFLGKSGGGDFEAVFQDQWHAKQKALGAGFHVYQLQGREGHPVRVWRLDHPDENEKESLVFVGVDCSLADWTHREPATSPTNHFGQGKAYRERIFTDVQLANQVGSDIKKEGRTPAVVWASHFMPDIPLPQNNEAPTQSQSVPEELSLIDGARLIYAMFLTESPLLLTGHLHEQKLPPPFNMAGRHSIKVACAGSVTAMDCGPNWSFNLLEIESKGGKIDMGKTQVRAVDWDKTTGEFSYQF